MTGDPIEFAQGGNFAVDSCFVFVAMYSFAGFGLLHAFALRYRDLGLELDQRMMIFGGGGGWAITRHGKQEFKT